MNSLEVLKRLAKEQDLELYFTGGYNVHRGNPKGNHLANLM